MRYFEVPATPATPSSIAEPLFGGSPGTIPGFLVEVFEYLACVGGTNLPPIILRRVAIQARNSGDSA